MIYLTSSQYFKIFLSMGKGNRDKTGGINKETSENTEQTAVNSSS